MLSIDAEQIYPETFSESSDISIILKNANVANRRNAENFYDYWRINNCNTSKYSIQPSKVKEKILQTKVEMQQPP